MGIQESTMRAAVADLVPTPRRGTGYGIFAAGFGVAAFIGGVLTGVLYDISIPLLIIVVAAIQAVALIVLVAHLADGAVREMSRRPRARLTLLT